MKKIKLVFLISLFVIPTLVFAYGAGLSTFPLKVRQKVLSAETTGIIKSGGGVGIQGRFTSKINNALTMDAGAGISSGKRESRFFMNADYEIFPDHDKQPRVSIRSTVERAREFTSSLMILQVAPIISKGISFWNHEGFPYLSIPFGLGLHSKTNTFHSRIGAVLGINGPIPFKGFEKFIGQLEARVDLKNSYSGIILGFAYSLD